MNDRAIEQSRLVVISGPSGSGKTTVCNRLIEGPNIVMSVSATTRPPRPGEKDGVNYYFLSPDEFRGWIEQGLFLEHAEYNGDLYGTPRSQLEEKLAAGATVLLEIDVQGARQLRENCPDALYIFLDAPNRDEGVRRLTRRNTETPEQVRRRLEAARRELEQTDLFDHKVVNDDLDETVGRIRELIREARRADTST